MLAYQVLPDYFSKEISFKHFRMRQLNVTYCNFSPLGLAYDEDYFFSLLMCLNFIRKKKTKKKANKRLLRSIVRDLGLFGLLQCLNVFGDFIYFSLFTLNFAEINMRLIFLCFYVHALSLFVGFKARQSLCYTCTCLSTNTEGANHLFFMQNYVPLIISCVENKKVLLTTSQQNSRFVKLLFHSNLINRQVNHKCI